MGQRTPELVQRAVERDLGIDIFWPDGTGKRAAVILLHGGGWGFGHRSDTHQYAKLLAQHGFVAIAAEYRLLGEAPWPAQINDVKDVIRWVRNNADFLLIDPQKIAVQGYSAGGHLALLAAGTAGKSCFGVPAPHPEGNAEINAVVAFFAAADLSGNGSPPVMRLLEGHGEAGAAEASPITHIAPGFPPTFLLSGTVDQIVPHSSSLHLFQVLSEIGTKTDLHLYHSHTHEFASLPSMLAPVQAEVALFLDRALVDPEFYRQENLRLNRFTQPGPPGAPPPPKL
jgi:acetyl esterase/lipase